MLTTQLFDPSNEVAHEALDILHEACDDEVSINIFLYDRFYFVYYNLMLGRKTWFLKEPH